MDADLDALQRVLGTLFHWRWLFLIVDRPDLTVRDALHPSPIRGLTVMTAGSALKTPGSAFQGEAIARLLQALKQEGEVVLCDCPPIMAKSFASLLASCADGVLVVVDCTRTRMRALAGTMAAVDGVHNQDRGECWGIVLNRLPVTGLSYFRMRTSSWHTESEAPWARTLTLGAFPQGAGTGRHVW